MYRSDSDAVPQSPGSSNENEKIPASQKALSSNHRPSRQATTSKDMGLVAMNCFLVLALVALLAPLWVLTRFSIPYSRVSMLKGCLNVITSSIAVILGGKLYGIYCRFKVHRNRAWTLDDLGGAVGVRKLPPFALSLQGLAAVHSLPWLLVVIEAGLTAGTSYLAGAAIVSTNTTIATVYSANVVDIEAAQTLVLYESQKTQITFRSLSDFYGKVVDSPFDTKLQPQSDWIYTTREPRLTTLCHPFYAPSTNIGQILSKDINVIGDYTLDTLAINSGRGSYYQMIPAEVVGVDTFFGPYSAILWTGILGGLGGSISYEFEGRNQTQRLGNSSVVWMLCEVQETVVECERRGNSVNRCSSTALSSWNRTQLTSVYEVWAGRGPTIMGEAIGDGTAIMLQTEGAGVPYWWNASATAANLREMLHNVQRLAYATLAEPSLLPAWAPQMAAQANRTLVYGLSACVAAILGILVIETYTSRITHTKLRHFDSISDIARTMASTEEAAQFFALQETEPAVWRNFKLRDRSAGSTSRFIPQYVPA